MLLPGVALLILFSYVPMYGIVMAFQRYIPSLGIAGSKWVGMQNFAYLFSVPDIGQKFANTLILACSAIALDMIVPLIVALLLNEVRHSAYKRTVQTIVYLPHFLSWVMLGLIFRQFLSLNGFVNNLLSTLGRERIFFMGSNEHFRLMLVITNSWKSFGWGTIIFLAAVTNIDPSLYEAATIDGAGRLRKVLSITMPGMMSVIVLKLTLSLGSVLSANFDQVFNLYSPLVYETGDIIDTYVYRMGLVQSQYSLSTAVGLLKSGISFVLIVLSYGLSYKFADYRIF
ncbi:MAG: ABC transporter permease subunit [Candidatus Limiplasma sp.]|nr:ABC transporter permease subunit [Candidatus Limiplasma sp.]